MSDSESEIVVGIDAGGSKTRVLVASLAGEQIADIVGPGAAMSRMEIADEVVVETDASIALADAFGDRSGVILIAGTGSIAFGRSPAGMLARCGGWGFTFGDEGSGAWIGRRAL